MRPSREPVALVAGWDRGDYARRQDRRSSTQQSSTDFEYDKRSLQVKRTNLEDHGQP